MAYTVNILNLAMTDIEDKVRYLKQEWGTALAKKAYGELMDKLALLATQPQMGSPVAELVNLGRSDYRILVHAVHTKVLYPRVRHFPPLFSNFGVQPSIKTRT